MQQAHVGGSFAPPLTPEALAKIKAVMEGASSQVKEAMTTLVNMVEKFSETPDSKQPAKRHMSGVGYVVPLEPEEVKRMDPHVPWKEELEMFGRVFESIPADTQKPLRDAAFHLLWYGHELFLDRQPMTKDKL